MQKIIIFLVSLIMLSGTAFSYPTVHIDLNAKIFPAFTVGPAQHYKTYYKPGDHVMLSTTWEPGYRWGTFWNDSSSKDATFVWKITNNNNHKSDPPLFEHEQINVLHNDYSGLAIPYTIPLTAQPGDIYTLTVSLSISGIKIVPKDKDLISTEIHVTNKVSTDLFIPNLGEFEQSDWRWGQDTLGTCNTTMTIDGCATTAKAFLFSYLDYNYRANYQPGILNECLRSQGGYALYKKQQYCLIPGNNTEMASKCKPYDVIWEGYFDGNGTTLSDRIKQYLESGFPVIVKAKQYGDKHYYVIVGQRDNNKWDVFDPLDGQIHYMEDRGLNNKMILGAYFYSQW